MNNNNLLNSYKYLSNWNPLINLENTPSKIVVTCFIQKGNKFLILQRARRDLQYKLWGIPGGKLDKGETSIQGLIRELYEELGIMFSNLDFNLLGTVKSKTISDGEYGLFLYYVRVFKKIDVKINKSEHLDFKWVTLDQFETHNLLLAQKEAYLYVSQKLKNLIKSDI